MSQTSGLVWVPSLCEKVRSASGTKRGERRAMGTLFVPVTIVRLGKSLSERELPRAWSIESADAMSGHAPGGSESDVQAIAQLRML